MADNSVEEFRMITVQLGEDIRESLNILKKRYKARSMTEALRRFMDEHDQAVLDAGAKVARIRRETSTLLDSEEAE